MDGCWCLWVPQAETSGLPVPNAECTSLYHCCTAMPENRAVIVHPALRHMSFKHLQLYDSIQTCANEPTLHILRPH